MSSKNVIIDIKLFILGEWLISRSQGKRVTASLDKFKEVILDFDKVTTVGQGFADEVFRVFAQKHPQVKLLPINMNEEVAFMVKRSII